MRARRAVALSLLFLAGLTSVAAQDIKTPLQLVPLWSAEMLDFLTGERQAACSGPNAAACERLNTGVCDDTAYFRIGLPQGQPNLPYRPPVKQTESAKPQAFALEMRHAGHSSVSRTFDYPSAPKTLQLVFGCSFSGNNECPANRFQSGAVRRVDMSVRDGEKTFDLTRAATVLPEGQIVVPIDDALRAFLLEDTNRTYQVRAVAECFSVRPSPIEWALPVYRSPDGGESAGALVVRVTPGSGMTFAYRPLRGNAAAFEPDWVAPDWGYTFLMQQTVLDRKGDWFLLPSRPFPTPVWIRLAHDVQISHVETRTVYVLSKSVQARSASSRRPLVVEAANIVVVSVRGRVLEIRKEDQSDNPCGDEAPERRRKVETYLVDVEEFYDADRHLQLQPAYVKGC